MRIVLLMILIGNSWMSVAQKLIIRETDSDNYFSFIKLINSDLTRYNESYDILKQSPYKFMTQWRALGADTLFWTNGENIYLCQISKNKKSKLVCKGLYWVLELFVTSNYLYVVYQPLKSNVDHDNRYEKGIRFCRIRMGDWKKEDIPLPTHFNVTNLTVSPNNNYVSFIHTIIGGNIKYQVVLFDLRNRKATVIDSADTNKDEWFGDDDKYNSSVWVNNNTFMYYKNASLTNSGKIVSFNLGSKSKKVILQLMPERDFSWFNYYNGYFYFSKRNTLYKTKDGIQKKTIYMEKNRSKYISEAVVLP